MLQVIATLNVCDYSYIGDPMCLDNVAAGGGWLSLRSRLLMMGVFTVI